MVLLVSSEKKAIKRKPFIRIAIYVPVGVDTVREMWDLK